MELLPEKKNGTIHWRLPKHLVHYEDGAEKGSAYALDLTYWDKVTELHDDIKVVSVEDLDWEADVHFRLQHVQGFPEGWSDIYSEYVFEGDLHRAYQLPYSHPMRSLANELSMQRLEGQIIDSAISNQLGGL